LPVIHGDGILPEVFPLCGYTSGRDVVVRDPEGFVIARERIAIGPIAPEDDTVFSEEFPELVECCLVISGFEQYVAVDSPDNFRSLDKDSGASG
jgi:hypothetical protein